MTPLVLVVDDNELNSKLVCDVLGAAGMTTLSAPTAAEGVALAHEHLPDVVLMDLRLPDFDGAEAARRLRLDERTARIPVVAVSAVGSEEASGWWQREGFAGYIEKPVDVRTLAAAVGRHCAGC